MRGKVYMMKRISEYEEDILRYVRLKLKHPMWCSVDDLISKKAEALRCIKKWWR